MCGNMQAYRLFRPNCNSQVFIGKRKNAFRGQNLQETARVKSPQEHNAHISGIFSFLGIFFSQLRCLKDFPVKPVRPQHGLMRVVALQDAGVYNTVVVGQLLAGPLYGAQAIWL